ncbi:unnamed protein product, partial [marine sediment metagenome]
MKTRNWMTTAAVALILLVGIASIYAASNPITTGRPKLGSGWMLVVSDDDMDTSAALLTELDSTFVQMAAATKIYAVSDSTDTTQTLYVSGVESVTGKYITESFTLAGATPTSASTATYDYVDQTWLDIECAGTITINRYNAAATLINSIEAGSLKGDLGHHFNGEKASYLQEWWATSSSATHSKTIELRWYPDDADCLDATTGFTLIDRIYMAGVVYASDIHPLHNTRLPAGGWLAIYGTG